MAREMRRDVTRVLEILAERKRWLPDERRRGVCSLGRRGRWEGWRVVVDDIVDNVMTAFGPDGLELSRVPLDGTTGRRPRPRELLAHDIAWWRQLY